MVEVGSNIWMSTLCSPSNVKFVRSGWSLMRYLLGRAVSGRTTASDAGIKIFLRGC